MGQGQGQTIVGNPQPGMGLEQATKGCLGLKGIGKLLSSIEGMEGSQIPLWQLSRILQIPVQAREETRDPRVDLAEAEIATRLGELQRAAAAAQRCLDHLADCDLIYVSFDVDSLDGTLFKGTGTPVAGGMWCHEALELNRTLLRDPRVCCWEICEINPHLDVLNALAEASLGIFQGVLEELEQRL